jgi:hypothetical protein
VTAGEAVRVPGPVLAPGSGRPPRSMPWAFIAGGAVGVLGGLIGSVVPPVARSV